MIEAGGVFLPGSVCYPLWNVLRQHLDRHRADGGQVRAEVAAALDALRAAGLAHVSAPGPVSETPADIEPPSTRGPVTTGQLADRLKVTDRHARRLAAAHGIEPLARGIWRREDADFLVTARRTDPCPRPPPYPPLKR